MVCTVDVFLEVGDELRIGYPFVRQDARPELARGQGIFCSISDDQVLFELGLLALQYAAVCVEKESAGHFLSLSLRTPRCDSRGPRLATSSCVALPFILQLMKFSTEFGNTVLGNAMPTLALSKTVSPARKFVTCICSGNWTDVAKAIARPSGWRIRTPSRCVSSRTYRRFAGSGILQSSKLLRTSLRGCHVCASGFPLLLHARQRWDQLLDAYFWDDVGTQAVVSFLH